MEPHGLRSLATAPHSAHKSCTRCSPGDRRSPGVPVPTCEKSHGSTPQLPQVLVLSASPGGKGGQRH